jgi:4-hydroxy-3-polyprenylbenzoate decarboxylase
MTPRRVILAVTGASGMPYAASLTRALSGREDLELHLIVSEAARTVLAAETDLSVEDLCAGAAATYRESDIAAPPASGSWHNEGMIVCPCSMATLAAIAQGLGTNLIHRAADVALKERRRLVLVARETPVSIVHLRNMLAAAEAGAVVMPACPGFYHRPAGIGELADHLAGRVLDQFGIPHALSRRWGEDQERRGP